MGALPTLQPRTAASATMHPSPERRALPEALRSARSTALNRSRVGDAPPPTAQVSLFGMLLLLVEVRLKPVRDWLRRNFGFFFTGSGRKGVLRVLA